MEDNNDLMLKIFLSALELMDDLSRIDKYKIAKGFDEWINDEKRKVMNEEDVFKYFTGEKDVRLDRFVWEIICYFQ